MEAVLLATASLTSLPLAETTLKLLLSTRLLLGALLLLHTALLLANAQVLPILTEVHAERAHCGQVEVACRAEPGVLLEILERSRRLLTPAPVHLPRVEAKLGQAALNLQHLARAGVERRTLTLELTALAELLLAKLLAELLAELLLTGLLPELLLATPLAGLLLTPSALLLCGSRLRRDQRDCSASKDAREQRFAHEISSWREKKGIRRPLPGIAALAD